MKEGPQQVVGVEGVEMGNSQSVAGDVADPIGHRTTVRRTLSQEAEGVLHTKGPEVRTRSQGKHCEGIHRVGCDRVAGAR